MTQISILSQQVGPTNLGPGEEVADPGAMSVLPGKTGTTLYNVFAYGEERSRLRGSMFRGYGTSLSLSRDTEESFSP
jgi:hypothetical protein